MRDTQKFCEYLYHSCYIPIYLYDGFKMTNCYPAQTKDTFPPEIYLKQLLETDKLVAYTLTDFNSYYGCVKMENTTTRLVVGPINSFIYNTETLMQMRREFLFEPSQEETFYTFFHNIPSHNLEVFINILLFINYALNNVLLTKKDISDYNGFFWMNLVHQEYSEGIYSDNEEEVVNTNYATERELLKYIETGNINELQNFTERAKNTRVGIVANDYTRQTKNIFIVAVTLSSRAAMKGGLSPTTAYKLSDIYLQQVERLTSVDDVNFLLVEMQKDYAGRVANAITPDIKDNDLHKAIEFVRTNTNKNIKVADVADFIGFSRPYLSRKVKKELGFNLSKFIVRCKLEESKNLLAFSEKSISQISNYLCFSSQSHFQKAFKDTFGITPQAYRRSQY